MRALLILALLIITPAFAAAPSTSVHCADDRNLMTADWRSEGGRYRLRINRDKWIVVPHENAHLALLLVMWAGNLRCEAKGVK